MSFCLIGFLYGHIQDLLTEKSWSKTVTNCAIVLSLGLWPAMINRFDFFAGGEGLAFVAGRFITSVLGSSAVIGLFVSIYAGGGQAFKEHFSGREFILLRYI